MFTPLVADRLFAAVGPGDAEAELEGVVRVGIVAREIEGAPH